MAEEKVENAVVEKKQTTETTTEETKVLPSDQVNDFVTDNANRLGSVVLILALLIGAWFAYDTYVVAPAELEGKNEIFMAQYYFQAGDYDAALNGKEGDAGFLDIAAEHGSDKIGNLANFYTGQIYLQQGEYQTAIDYLEEFSSKDMFVGALAIASIGDAYAEMGETSKAVTFYKKAANYNDNSFTTPLYLMKLANALEINDNPGEALGYYEMIKKSYPNSAEGRDIEKFIAKAKAMVQ
jgi:tetratricopeptide (TPR) repeat protein